MGGGAGDYTTKTPSNPSTPWELGRGGKPYLQVAGELGTWFEEEMDVGQQVSEVLFGGGQSSAPILLTENATMPRGNLVLKKNVLKKQCFQQKNYEKYLIRRVLRLRNCSIKKKLFTILMTQKKIRICLLKKIKMFSLFHEYRKKSKFVH